MFSALTCLSVRIYGQVATRLDLVRGGFRLKCQSSKGGLHAVYRTLELPGQNPLKDAHAALDAAVLAAYGFSAKKDLLQQLLDLNLEVAARLERGEPVTAPGIPPDFPDSESLIAVFLFWRLHPPRRNRTMRASTDRQTDALVYKLYGLSDQENTLIENAPRRTS
jgi:hypothetical protein